MAALLQLAKGQILAGEFRVEHPLREGGMGAVYVAEQLSTGELRALKVMQPHLAADERARARFGLEARIGSRIRSEHVVKVVGAGVDDATKMPWLAMELLEGTNLWDLVETQGRRPHDEVAATFRQLGHALSRAHAQGIVHRDLKPENLFLARSERSDGGTVLKVLDFGIAKLTRDASVHRSTMAIGSPLWMAPEQTRPGGDVDARTDIWALGLIAFHALTGKVFWLAGNVESRVEAILTEMLVLPIPSASARASELGVVSGALPSGFDAWFARCVSRETAGRFADVDVCVAELASLLTARPRAALAPTQPMSPPAPTPTPSVIVDYASLSPSDMQAPSAASARAPAPTPTRPEPPDVERARPVPGASTTSPIENDVEVPVSPARSWGVAVGSAGVVGALLVGLVWIAIGASEAPPVAPTRARGAVEPTEAPLPPEPESQAPTTDVEAPIAPVTAVGAESEPVIADWPVNPFVPVTPPSPAVQLGVSESTAALGEEVTGFRPARGITSQATAFAIQQHEVTWRELSSFPFASGLRRPRGVTDRHPATAVPWDIADAYCRSIGGRLPTEEEWETAARGAARRSYPWGDEPPRRDGVRIYRGLRDVLGEVATSGQDRTPGDDHAAIYDLLGNAQEWTLDRYRSDDPATSDAWTMQGGRIWRAARGLPPQGAMPARLHPEGAAARTALCTGTDCPAGTEERMRYVGFRCAR